MDLKKLSADLKPVINIRDTLNIERIDIPLTFLLKASHSSVNDELDSDDRKTELEGGDAGFTCTMRAN